jgi:hypothetical protein
MTITESIGKDVMHGSPGHMNKETIRQIAFLKESVEIEFESGAFTTMAPAEFEHFIRYKELSYNEKHHGGMSEIVFCD